MTDIDVVIAELNRLNKAEHVHTINKAAYYLGVIQRTHNPNTELLVLVRRALKTQDWMPVKTCMKNWW